MVRVCVVILCFLFVSSSTSASMTSAEQHSLVVGRHTRLLLSPSLLVEKSPGAKPGATVFCERTQIHGLSRLKNLRRFANSVKVKVSYVNATVRPPNIEVCFHRNASLGVGMCSQGRWDKLTTNSWARSMSPFDNKLLDIRIVGSASKTLEVVLDEEFFLFHIIFLVLGLVLMILASFLSNSLVFYYSGAMGIGIVLLVLVILFQGMKLLPTGRRNSLVIFMYSCVVGLGSFLLGYVPRLLHAILSEFGIGEDMYIPLAIFLLVFLILAGAWLGFVVVRKLVLRGDGSIDTGVSCFAAWSIRIFASVLILQSTVDPLLAAEALVCVILISSLLNKIIRRKCLRRIYKKLQRAGRHYHRISQSPVGDPHVVPFNTPIRDSDSFYSTVHSIPGRRKPSEDEWEKFTKESTKTALESLVSSPEFSRWAVAHAERITLTPKKDADNPRRRRFSWF